MRLANAVVDGVPVALFALDGQQRFEVSDVAVVFLDCLFGKRHEVGADGGQPDRFAVLKHTGLFQGVCLVFQWMASVVLASNRS